MKVPVPIRWAAVVTGHTIVFSEVNMFTGFVLQSADMAPFWIVEPAIDPGFPYGLPDSPLFPVQMHKFFVCDRPISYTSDDFFKLSLLAVGDPASCHGKAHRNEH